MTRFVSEDIYQQVSKGVEEHGLRPYARDIGLPVGVVRSVLDKRDLSASSIEKLCDALDTQITFGKPVSPLQLAEWIQENYGHVLRVGNNAQKIVKSLGIPSEVAVDGQKFAAVARHEASAAAGDGIINFDEPAVDHLAFSKKWLSSSGIKPEACVLMTARGDSMKPSIHDGDLVMVDRRKRKIKNGRIYVYNDPTDGTRLKRFELVPNHALIVRSDNPDQKTYPPRYHVGEEMNDISDNIVGQVVWSGHKWN